MKKIFIGISAAIVLAGLAYYPSYRIPIAHRMIESEVSALKALLELKDLGTLEITEHTTDRSISHFEVLWQLKLPYFYGAFDDMPPLTAKSVIDIHLGFLPSSKGFSSIISSTSSADFNTALENQGHKDGFTLDCITDATSASYDSKCTTNAITLENANTQAQDIHTIMIAANELHIGLDQSKGIIDARWTMPSFELSNKDAIVGLVENIQYEFSQPYDSTGIVPIFNTLTGKEVIDGPATSLLLIDTIKIAPEKADQPIILSQLKSTSTSEIIKGIAEGQADFSIDTIDGLPVDVQSIHYDLTFKDFDAKSLAAIGNITEYMAQNLHQGNTPTNTPPFDMATIQSHIVATLSKGPQLNQEISVTQSTDDDLNIKAEIAFKAASADDINAAIAPLIESQAKDKAAILNFVLEYIKINLNADVDTAMAQNIASLVTAGNPNTPQASPEQQKQAVEQGLSMLEMFGVLEKNETGYTSNLSVDDKGILLNEKDIAPMLGLPPRNNATSN